MFKNIEIKSTYTKELALKASKLFYDWDMRNSSKRYIGWIFIAMMQFGVVGALKHDSFGILFVSTFLVIYWYYGRWYLRKVMIEKFYNKSYQDTQEILFILKDDGLHYDSELMDWDSIENVIQLDGGVLIHTKNNTLFFEKSSFSSYEDMQTFLLQMKSRDK